MPSPAAKAGIGGLQFQRGGSFVRSLITILNSGVERLVADTHDLREILQYKFAPFMDYKDVVAPGSRLLSRCRPPAIARFIVTVRINAVQRHIIRTFAHICEKLVKRINPFRAHGYTPSAVQGIFFIRWIQAPCLRVAVGSKSFARSAVNCMAVADRSSSCDLLTKASTTHCSPCAHSVQGSDEFNPTIARKPPFSATHERLPSNGDQPPISLPSNIQCGVHRTASFV